MALSALRLTNRGIPTYCSHAWRSLCLESLSRCLFTNAASASGCSPCFTNCSRVESCSWLRPQSRIFANSCETAVNIYQVIRLRVNTSNMSQRDTNTAKAWACCEERPKHAFHDYIDITVTIFRRSCFESFNHLLPGGGCRRHRLPRPAHRGWHIRQSPTPHVLAAPTAYNGALDGLDRPV